MTHPSLTGVDPQRNMKESGFNLEQLLIEELNNIVSSYLLTYRAEPFLRKLPLVQLLKDFPALYGTRRFIAMFTRALSTGPYPEPYRSSPHHPILAV
jgi:hypothetical protein